MYVLAILIGNLDCVQFGIGKIDEYHEDIVKRFHIRQESRDMNRFKWRDTAAINSIFRKSKQLRDAGSACKL